MDKKKVKCRVCGIYYVAQSEGHEARKLCGKVCRLIYRTRRDEKYWRRDKLRNERRREKEKKEIICEYCKTTFIALPFNIVHGYKNPRLYCSKECKNKAAYYRKKDEAIRRKFVDEKIKEREIESERQRVEDERHIQYMLNKYGSPKERIKELLNSRIVKKWKSYLQYTESEAFEKLKEAAFLRDKDHCKFCQYKPDTIHHLFYRKWGTEQLSDVISVCNHCHIEHCHTDILYQKELDAIMGK